MESEEGEHQSDDLMEKYDMHGAILQAHNEKTPTYAKVLDKAPCFKGVKQKKKQSREERQKLTNVKSPPQDDLKTANWRDAG